MKKSRMQAKWIFVLGAGLIVIGILLMSRFETKDRSSNSEFDSALLADISAAELQQKIRESTAKVKLLNMWATWCGPCVEEFPAILQLREKYKDQGFELYFVSADMLEERKTVEDFLREQGVDFQTYLKTEGDEKFMSSLNPDWSGALPASFIYDDQGKLVHFWTGDATFEEFEERVLSLLNKQKET